GVGELRDVAAPLISFYGQHEHRKLTLASSQLEVLDAFCGAEQAQRRADHAAAYARARDLAARLEELRERAGSRERELDLLRFELEEIEAADPSEPEAADLRAERERLRHLEGLRAAAAGGAEALAPEEGGPGAAPRLAAAVRERLGELAMEGAGFEVALEPRPQRGPTGDEAAEFLIAPNPGVPGGPLREIASGGELSRVMLALMGVAAEAGGEH